MQHFHKFLTWRLCVAEHVSGVSLLWRLCVAQHVSGVSFLWRLCVAQHVSGDSLLWRLCVAQHVSGVSLLYVYVWLNMFRASHFFDVYVWLNMFWASHYLTFKCGWTCFGRLITWRLCVAQHVSGVSFLWRLCVAQHVSGVSLRDVYVWLNMFRASHYLTFMCGSTCFGRLITLTFMCGSTCFGRLISLTFMCGSTCFGRLITWRLSVAQHVSGVSLLDVYVWLNMFRVSPRPSSDHDQQRSSRFSPTVKTGAPSAVLCSLHVRTCSGRNHIIPLMRRPNTDSTPKKPVTLLRNQLLIRYAGTSPVHTVTIRCYDTR